MNHVSQNQIQELIGLQHDVSALSRKEVVAEEDGAARRDEAQHVEGQRACHAHVRAGAHSAGSCD